MLLPAGQVLMSSPALIVLDEEGELLNKDRGDGSLASGGESAGPSPLASGRRLSRLKSSRSGRYYLKVSGRVGCSCRNR
jgi:hypothetical protein